MLHVHWCMSTGTFSDYFDQMLVLRKHYQNCISDFIHSSLESRFRIILDRIRMTCYTKFMHVTGFEVTELRWHATCTFVHAHRNIFWLFYQMLVFPKQYQNCISDCIHSIRMTYHTIFMHITGFEAMELRRHATCTFVYEHKNNSWLFF